MLSRPVNGPDKGQQERAPRHMTVLINAAVVQGERDGLCRIRNMSREGLLIETALPLAIDEPLTIALHSGRTLSCVARWSKDGRTGLSCDVDPTNILLEERPAAEIDAGEPSLPRFLRPMDMEIVAHGFVHRCMLDSISTRDVILTGTPPALDASQITVCLPHLGNFTATVRVRDEGNVFARFTTPVSFAELNRWLVKPSFMLARRLRHN